MVFLPFISNDASWLGLIFDLTALITLLVTIYQMKAFWLSFKTQNLSIDARKGLDNIDEFEDNLNALLIIVRDPHQGEAEYALLLNTFLNPLNSLQNVLHVLSVRVNIDFSQYLLWVKSVRKMLLQKQLKGSKAEDFLSMLDGDWKQHDELDSVTIKNLQCILLDIYQFPDNYLKKK